MDETTAVDYFLPALIEFACSGLFSIREIILLAHYCNPESPAYLKGVRSAELAGFKASPPSLRVQASKTLRKARTKGLFRVILEFHKCTFEAIAERLHDHLHARKKAILRTKDGELIERDLGHDYAAQLAAMKLLVSLLGITPQPEQAAGAPSVRDHCQGNRVPAAAIAAPHDLTPGESELQETAASMDPATRVAMCDVIAEQEEIVKDWVQLSQLKSVGDDDHQLDPDDGKESS